MPRKYTKSIDGEMRCYVTARVRLTKEEIDRVNRHLKNNPYGYTTWDQLFSSGVYEFLVDCDKNENEEWEQEL